MCRIAIWRKVDIQSAIRAAAAAVVVEGE